MTTGEYSRALRRLTAESRISQASAEEREGLLVELARQTLLEDAELAAYFRLRGFSGEIAAEQMMRDALFLERNEVVV